MRKFLTFKIISLFLGIILVSSIGSIFLLKRDRLNNIQLKTNISEVVEEKEPASAAEIYPLFECPCCGKLIAECSCPMAKERMAFIDGATAKEVSKDEAILAYVKKYGLSSFIEDEKKEEFQEKLAKDAPQNRPIISLNSDSYDLGDVSQKQGIATTIFELKNEGKEDLIIERLETSCGCTSVSLIYNGVEGPKFNMPGHGINEEVGDWQMAITPGTSAQLKIYYDPNMHLDFRGAATRSIYIYSNDPIDFQKEIQIELNQID